MFFYQIDDYGVLCSVVVAPTCKGCLPRYLERYLLLSRRTKASFLERQQIPSPIPIPIKLSVLTWTNIRPLE